jgi:hypothetical protein
MVLTRLSDADLRQLVQEDGETASGAREELEKRHYQAVRAFAFVVSPVAGDRLAGEAWEQALRPLDEDITGAVRPRALAAVLRTAAEWLRIGRRGELATELVNWFEPDGPEAADGADGTGGTGGIGAAGEIGGTSGIGVLGGADTSRNTLLNREAPRGGDDADLVAALVYGPGGDRSNGADGSGMLELDAVAGAAGAAGATGAAAGRSDAGALRLARFRSSSVTARAFERLPARSQTVLWHHEVEHDDAAAIHELLGTEAEDVTLLDRRARRELYNTYVSLHQDETVDDACRRLHRMLLAYAEQTTMNTPGDLVSHLDRCAHCARAVDDLERMRFEFGSVLAEALLPWGGADYALSAHTLSSPTLEVSGAPGAFRPGAGGLKRWAAGAGAVGAAAPGRLLGALRTRLVALPGMGSLPGARPAPGDERSRRARRAVLAAALVGVCSLVVAVAYTGGLRQGAENDAAPRPGDSGAAAPGGSKPTATATSTVTATKPPPGNGFAPAKPVRGAALEWRFDAVDDGRTVDTSGNGEDGELDGDPLPELAEGGFMEFAGQQSVVADGPVVDTSKSFSVSARAKLNDTEDFQTVISQDASRISGFAVQYDPESDRWEMIAPEEDDEDSDLIQAGGPPGPPADRWTYLTGVHDAEAGELRLYVDGKLEDTASLDGDDAAQNSTTTTTSGGSSTTTTTTSGGGFGGDGQGGDDGFGGGRGGPGGFDGGGGGGFGGGAGGPGGGFFGGPAAADQDFAVNPNLPGGAFANEIIQDVTGTIPRVAPGTGRAEVIDAEGDFAAGRALAGDEFDRGFDGAIDDVRAFKRVLTAKEISALAGR